ncbi:hypothetical protein ACO1PK_05165 [Alishewanella sp. d11]|uniref:hypothetical protein n=1 Tax=Alishewanella sp. d11 TaxID=3414030 RepID=UPI003BF7A813
MTISTRKLVTSLAVVLLSSSPLLASAASTGYKMALIEDAPGAAFIKAGQFAEAIAQVQAEDADKSEPFYRQVSLCVAYSSTADFTLAATACGDAVQLAANLQAIPRSAKREMRALALNNRGVMHLMAGDKVAALQDFIQAVRIDNSELTLANLERLTVSINGVEVQEIALQAAE